MIKWLMAAAQLHPFFQHTHLGFVLFTFCQPVKATPQYKRSIQIHLYTKQDPNSWGVSILRSQTVTVQAHITFGPHEGWGKLVDRLNFLISAHKKRSKKTIHTHMQYTESCGLRLKPYLVIIWKYCAIVASKMLAGDRDSCKIDS